MDILSILAAGIVVFSGAWVGGFVATMLIQGVGYGNLAGKLQRIENKIASGQGIEVKSEKAARMSEAMAKAMLIMKDETIPKEEKPKAVMALAAEFPDVALDVVKKVGFKGLI